MTTSSTIQSLILAAGLGTRMRSRTIKVLHQILGRPMIGHVVEAALGAQCTRVIPILGHQRKKVQQWLDGQPHSDQLAYAFQDEQNGTAHAVWSARRFLDDRAPEYTAILCGDVPNMDASTLRSFFDAAIDSGRPVALVTARVEHPGRYGRIIRSDGDDVTAIVEYADATEKQRAIDEINAGIYLVRTSFLARALATIMERPADNAQGEYYLTDLIELGARQAGVFGWAVDDARKIQGVNTRADLAAATAFARRRINERWMLEGVTFLDASTTFVDVDVDLASDVTLYPNTHLQGTTTVGRGTTIETGCVVRDSIIGETVHLRAHCYLQEASIDNDTTIGPFAHLRPGADIGKGCKVGNFVEVKKSRLDDGAKASHLTYLGDAHVGKNANIGAGTITCNYDGQKKSRTQICEAAFIGSNTALVAPVKIGKGAYVGAGSVITDDLPPRSLGVARGRQRIIDDWADE